MDWERRFRGARGKKGEQDKEEPEPDIDDGTKGNTKRGRELFKEGKYKEAKEAYDEALRIKPDCEGAYSGRAGCYLKMDEVDLAERDIEKCFEITPESDHGYAKRGLLLLKQDKLDEAMVLFTKAININEKNKDAAEGYRDVLGMRDVDVGQVSRRARRDTDVKQIIDEPKTKALLEMMQNDPKTARRKIQRRFDEKVCVQLLVQSGVIRFTSYDLPVGVTSAVSLLPPSSSSQSAPVTDPGATASAAASQPEPGPGAAAVPPPPADSPPVPQNSLRNGSVLRPPDDSTTQ